MANPSAHKAPTAGGESGESVSVLAERIGYLVERVDDTNCVVKEMAERLSTFERSYVAEYSAVVNQAAAAHRRLDDLARAAEKQNGRIEAIEKAIFPLIFSNRVMAWLAGIMGVSVVTLIWMIILGQVKVVFP